MHTIQSLSDAIQARWESDLPDRVLDALRPFNGKAITSRLLDKLPGGKDAWHLYRQYGWTEIKTMEYIRSQGRTGLRLIIARSESSVPLDLALVEKENPAYFAGRRERNHARMEARNDRDKLSAMVDVLNSIETLRAQLDEAIARFDALTDYGEVFSPDRYELQRMCGLRQPGDA